MMLQPKSGVHFPQLSSFVIFYVILKMQTHPDDDVKHQVWLLALCMNASQHHTSCHQNLLCLPKIWLTLDNMASQGLLHLKQSRKHTTPYQSKHEISVVISTHTNSSRAVVLGQDTNPKQN